MRHEDRRNIALAKTAVGAFKKEHTLTHCYFSDYFFDRLIERKLDKDLPFIMPAIMFVYRNQFELQTYNYRRYLVSYKRLKIGVEISLGSISAKRTLSVTTVFEADQQYQCDEHICLK